VVEMIDKVTLWNKTGERLDIEIKMIVEYFGMLINNEETRTFSPERNTRIYRELVLEISKCEEEEEDD